jgi:hypothetical protein
VDEAVRQLQSEGHFSVDGAGKITFLKKKAAEESDRFSTNSFVARESYRMANETRKDPAKLVPQPSADTHTHTHPHTTNDQRPTTNDQRHDTRGAHSACDGLCVRL